VSQYQKGKTNLDFTEARDSERRWHQLGHMQACTLLQTDTTPAPHHSVFLQAGCPSCRPTNSVKALKAVHNTHTHTHTHPFNGPLSGSTQVSRYQKTNLDFTEARDSEWQWHQLGHMQVCTSLQTDNHTSTPPLSFFTGRMPFLPPNQQHQSTEGTWFAHKVFIKPKHKIIYPLSYFCLL